MKSLKILTSYKILNISSIETTPTFIKAQGDDFSRTKFIMVNGYMSTDFAIAGSTILVYPPEGVSTDDIGSLYIVAESETIETTTLMQLGFGYVFKQVSGTDRLVQMFVLDLLSTPGTYILDQNRGGGVLEIMKKYGSAQPEVVLPNFVAAIRKTESDIKAMQAGLKLTADERLLAVNIIDTSIKPSDSSVNVFVELVTLNGSRRAFNVGI